jgi:hypothetical protein
MPDLLWPIIAAGARCFGFCAGIEWAAQWRPVRVDIHTTHRSEGPNA